MWARLSTVMALLLTLPVVAMPAIVLHNAAGRAFGYLTLFRSMIDTMSWLALCALLGVANGLVRLG